MGNRLNSEGFKIIYRQKCRRCSKHFKDHNLLRGRPDIDNFKKIVDYDLCKKCDYEEGFE